MKTRQIIKSAREITAPFRMGKGQDYRVRDVDPKDTLGRPEHSPLEDPRNSEPHTMGRESESRTRPSKLPAYTIRTFLADDSPFLLALLARIVSKNRKVSILGTATDGRKTLCNAATLQLDLVVTDLHMPGMDGAEVARRLKQLPNPPIIFVVTSDDTPEAQARCMAAGADVFLVKAANLVPQLLSAIQEFFPDDLEQNDAECHYVLLHKSS